MNKVIIVGRVGQDPETRYTQDGKPIHSFSVATSEYYNGKENTEWHSCVMFGEQRVIEYVRKGTSVAIEGKITTKSWEDDSGQKKYRTEITVFRLELCGPKQGNGRDDNRPAFRNNGDDIPF